MGLRRILAANTEPRGKFYRQQNDSLSTEFNNFLVGLSHNCILQITAHYIQQH